MSPIPLVPELGAAQMAINLADALRNRGAEVRLWSIPPKKGRHSWWLPPFRYWRREVENFVISEGPFDVIDAPAQAIARRLSQQSVCVARGVQPELRYQWAAIRYHRWRTPKDLAHWARACIVSVYVAWSLWRGWSHAHKVLCLGSLDRDWMLRRFPWWKRKIDYYVNALCSEDQKNLAAVRQKSEPTRAGEGVRFLWLGRWVAHKGTHILVDFMRQRLANCPRDSFTLAGCGPGPYHGLPAELLGNERVHIIPQFPRSKLPQLLAEHDIGLFTSIVEGWGLSLNEMLEAGMSVYATGAGGVQDLKPIFRGVLRFFPPGTCVARSDSKEGNAVDWLSYYRSFSWQPIACDYLSMFRDTGFSVLDWNLTGKEKRFYARK